MCDHLGDQVTVGPNYEPLCDQNTVLAVLAREASDKRPVDSFLLPIKQRCHNPQKLLRRERRRALFSSKQRAGLCSVNWTKP